MQSEGTLDKIWNELQRQLDAKGLKVKTGVIQDATFIEADFGKKRYQEEKKAKKEGREIEYTDKQKAHMDKDGTFAVKGQEVHFGYKLHQKSDVDFGLIRDFGVTTASTNDNQVDLVESGDNAAYRDKGYAGTKLRAKVKDMTMKKAARNRPLTKAEKRFNISVAKIRSQGERPFAVIQRVFNGGTTRVKNIGRVSVQQAIECFAFNLYQLFTLKKQGRF